MASVTSNGQRFTPPITTRLLSAGIRQRAENSIELLVNTEWCIDPHKTKFTNTYLHVSSPMYICVSLICTLIFMQPSLNAFIYFVIGVPPLQCGGDALQLPLDRQVIFWGPSRRKFFLQR